MMLETILARRLRPGDRLPSERELGEQFGVSRTVIREAVRSLAAKGVIEVRSGSGLRVAAVAATNVTESMSLFLRHSSDLDYPKVHEVRTILEVEIARIAAERATEADVALLTDVCERMEAAIDDVEVAAPLDVEFHRAIARSTQNELFLVLLDAIGDALLEIRRENLSVGSATETVTLHRRILKRINAHDPEGACGAMKEHLDSVEKFWRQRAAVTADSAG
jgi:GntR family transcriptional regulator, transcriptional repressor for pyruvate dehydrogenase complex